MAVASKSYLIKMNQFKEGYCASMLSEALKQAGVKDLLIVTWKRYVKLVYGVSYAKAKRSIDVFKFCAVHPAVCWCEIAPSKLYETNAKVLKDIFADGAYKKLEKKVKNMFLVSYL